MRARLAVLLLIGVAASFGGCGAPARFFAFPPYEVEGAVTLERVDRETLTPALVREILKAHAARIPTDAKAFLIYGRGPRSRRIRVATEITEGGLIGVHLLGDQVESLLHGSGRVEIECERGEARFRRVFSLDEFAPTTKDLHRYLATDTIFCFGGWQRVR